ncbi:YdcF family protein [Kaarinaea lacus]
MTSLIRDKFDSLQIEGILTFLLSNVVLTLSAGMTGLWAMRTVFRHATEASPDIVDDNQSLLVLGKKLDNGKADEEYQQRLQRAATLLNQQAVEQVIILGGITGGNPVSEAKAGKDTLVSLGVDASKIVTEDRSRHTLENLRFAREMLGNNATSQQQVAIITNRYHLARAHTLASGLKIDHALCAAEDRFSLDLKLLAKLMVEAYFLHWYYSGKYWSLWTNNKKWLERIT